MSKTKLIKLKSDCDDAMFMTSEIELEYREKGKWAYLSLQLQSGRSPAVLRKGEIQQLIDNLQKIHDLIPD